MELGFEDKLRHLFPLDDVTPVPKEIHGGDVVHGVHDGVHGLCGSILWESKRTKNWSDGWLPKLCDDQRAAKAQYAILISAELPTNHFFVWTDRRCVDYDLGVRSCGSGGTAP